MTTPSRHAWLFPDGMVSGLTWRSPRPTLHFGHANGFNAGTYTALLSPLGDAFNILATDARGHGFSTLPAQPGMAGNWTVFRDDLLQLIERFDDRAPILAGHSMGAITAILAAVNLGSRVRALVLIEPVLTDPVLNPGTALSERTLRRRAQFDSFDDAFAAHKGRGAFRSWPDNILEDYLRGGLREGGDGKLHLGCEPAWEAEIFRETPMGVAQLADRIACPVTLLYGEKGIPPKKEIERFEKLHGGTRAICVPGASHFLPMECPETVIAEIRRYA